MRKRDEKTTSPRWLLKKRVMLGEVAEIASTDQSNTMRAENSSGAVFSKEPLKPEKLTKSKRDSVPRDIGYPYQSRTCANPPTIVLKTKVHGLPKLANIVKSSSECSNVALQRMKDKSKMSRNPSKEIQPNAKPFTSSKFIFTSLDSIYLNKPSENKKCKRNSTEGWIEENFGAGLDKQFSQIHKFTRSGWQTLLDNHNGGMESSQNSEISSRTKTSFSHRNEESVDTEAGFWVQEPKLPQFVSKNKRSHETRTALHVCKCNPFKQRCNKLSPQPTAIAHNALETWALSRVKSLERKAIMPTAKNNVANIITKRNSKYIVTKHRIVSISDSNFTRSQLKLEGRFAKARNDSMKYITSHTGKFRDCVHRSNNQLNSGRGLLDKRRTSVYFGATPKYVPSGIGRRVLPIHLCKRGKKNKTKKTKAA